MASAKWMKAWLAAVLAVGLAVAPSYGATEEVNGVTWTYLMEKGNATVTGASPAAGALVIPSTLGGRAVTGIRYDAFQGCDQIVSATIPNTVTNIGSDAFSGCTGLVSVSIPDGMRHIGSDVFEGCPGPLFDMNTIPGVMLVDGWAVGCTNTLSGSLDLTGARGVADHAFRHRSLTSVYIPATVTGIGRHPFSGGNFTSITVAAGNAFYSSLNGVLFSKSGDILYIFPAGKSGKYTIPDGVKRIEEYAFFPCEELRSVTMPDSVASIGDSAFQDCSGLKSVTFGNGVTNIGNSAFEYCYALQSVAIPDSVKRIESLAFDQCSKLASVTIGTGAEDIEDQVFSDCPELTQITVAAGNAHYASKDGVLFTAGCGTLHSFPGGRTGAYTIPDGVTNILGHAFSGCSGLTSVTIPDSVIEVGYRAFEDCDGLTTLTVPAAWEGTDMLADAEVPPECNVVYAASALELGEYDRTFPADGASGLELEVMASVPWWAESSASWLTVKTAGGTGDGTIVYDVSANTGAEERTGTITVTGAGITRSFTVTQSGSGITWFYVISDGKATVTGSDPVAAGDLTIPSSLGGCPVTDIGQSAFSACTGLTSVTIPDSVTNIGTWAFSNWSSPLESVRIGNGVQTIGEGAFEGCSALSSVSFGNSVRTIENDAFSLCKGLVSVNLPVSVTRIGIGAFSECGMTSMHIPAGVADIGVDAFFRCDNLTSFTVAAGNTHFSTTDGLLISKNGKLLVCCPPGRSGAFSIPSGVTDIGQQAFDECAKLTSVSIPDTVTNIGVGAFSCCYQLESVDIPDSVTGIGFVAFTDCSSLRSVAIPAGVKNIENSLFQNSGVSSVTIPNGVTNIGDSAFWNCPNLETLIIPDSVQRVGDWAFDGCDGLATLYVPASWQGTDMLASAGVPEGCRVVYGSPQAQLTLSVNERGFTASAAVDQQLGVTANVPWMAGTSTPWLTVRTWSGSGNGTIVYDVAANTEPEARTGTIMVAGGGITRTFTVMQDGKVPPASGQPQKLTFDANGGRCDTAWDEYTIGGTYGYLPAAMWDEGVVFAGWFTLPDGGEPVTASDIVTAEEERTIHAHWRLLPTAACPVPVPCEWLAAHGSGGGAVQAYVTAAESAAANGMRVWECYVAGLDPTDAAAEFKAELVFEDGKWKAKPKGGEKAGRVYRVKGKKAIAGTEEWQDLTDAEDVERGGWRFLRVGVELEESEP